MTRHPAVAVDRVGRPRIGPCHRCGADSRSSCDQDRHRKIDLEVVYLHASSLVVAAVQGNVRVDSIRRSDTHIKPGIFFDDPQHFGPLQTAIVTSVDIWSLRPLQPFSSNGASNPAEVLSLSGDFAFAERMMLLWAEVADTIQKRGRR